MENKNETIMGTQESTPTIIPNKSVTTEVTSTNLTLTNNIDSEFNRANIEALDSLVRKVDQDEEAGLDLFCYIKCNSNDNELIQNCRGVVFHNQEVVMKAFSYTIEYNHTEVEKIEENIGSTFEQCIIYESQEGALIRMFNFKEKWYISTHRKLNAFRSKWSSRESFGATFLNALETEFNTNSKFNESLPEGDDILDRFKKSLDVNKQYMFLVRNNLENRIVCSPSSEPKLYHVGTFIDKNLVLTENINISYPKKIDFSSINEMCKYVSSVNPSSLQGVIIFAPNNKQIKILNKDYQDLFRARGNEPSIKFRYLQVRLNKKQNGMLYYLYPEMSSMFDKYENNLYEIAKIIYRSYVQRFIKKRYVSVPREEFAIIRECHEWHLKNREENKINQEKIIEILNKQSPTNLNHMIHRFNLEQESKKIVQNTVESRNRSNTLSNNSPVNTSITPTLLPVSIDQRYLIPNINI